MSVSEAKYAALLQRIDELENDNRFRSHVAALRQEIEDMNKDYYLEVAKGNVAGTTGGFVVGRNNDVGATNSESVWDIGGNYTYLTADTQLYISSTDALDVDVDIIITGLDDNYLQVTRTVNTNGQSQVAISDLMFRVLTVFTAPTSANHPVGDIYLAETDTLTAGVPNTATKIKALIPLARTSAGVTIDSGTDFASDNFSHLGLYTVPAGKTAYLIAGFTFVGKNSDVTFSGRVRLQGGHWFNRSPSELYQAPGPQGFEVRLPIGEKTDIEWRCIAGSVGTTVNFQVQFVLVDN